MYERNDNKVQAVYIYTCFYQSFSFICVNISFTKSKNHISVSFVFIIGQTELLRLSFETEKKWWRKEISFCFLVSM